ncbi:MAG: hypothetical protein JW754_05295 [Candidatus Aenigmarchaeota archaeon]|nr:hypothetical protein [Candidatus Aenigmarchaeota archaeon]
MRAFLVALICFSLLIVPGAFAEVSTPAASGGTFVTEDHIDLSCTFTNDLYNETTSFIIESALISPGMSILPSIGSVTLAPSESHEITDFSFTVTDTIPSGSYSLLVNVVKDNELVETSNFEFTIQGTTSAFSNLNLQVCGDLECNDPRKIHNISEGLAFIRVFSTDSPELSGTVLYPDGTTADITFIEDFGEVWFSQLGTYRLYILAAKDGYESETMETEFYVVKGDSISLETCADESDNVCDENCPYGIDVDCYYTDYRGELVSPLGSSLMNAVVLLAVLIIIVIVLVIIVLKVVRSRGEPVGQRIYTREGY